MEIIDSAAGTATIAETPLVFTDLPGEPSQKRPKGGTLRRLLRSKKMLVGMIMLVLFILLAIFGPWLAHYPPSEVHNMGTGPDGLATHLPTAGFPLGQNDAGQDLLSQLLAGSRSTIEASFLAGAIGTILAIIIGISAGYIGGWVDEVLSLLSNVFLVLPAFPLLIAVAAMVGPEQTGQAWVSGLIIGLTAWAWGARVMRAQTLSMRNRDFVEAARVSGESTWRIITREIAPNLAAVISSSLLFTTIYAVGTYVGLAFIGVIAPGPTYNWGSMLNDAATGSATLSGYWFWYIPPGILIALLGTSLALLNFGIDEYINPRLRVASSPRETRKRLGFKLKPQLGFTPVVRMKSDAAPRRAEAIEGTL